MLTRFRIIYACFSSTTAAGYQDHMATKPRTFTVGSFRRSWPTPYLNLKIGTSTWCKSKHLQEPDTLLKMGEMPGVLDHGLW